MVDKATFEDLLALGHETRSFEVKGPGSVKDKRFCAKIARAVIAMGNLRDGGLVCIGIDETSISAMEPGLTPELFAEWSDFDRVSDAIARYVDPPADFSVCAFALSSGALVVVLDVDEFQDVPHLCKRGYPDELREGMAYVRPRGKPESIPVPTSTEMRDLLDLATDKAVREFVRRAGAAGLLIGEPMAENSASSQFDLERDEIWNDSSPTMQRILSGGYTDCAVRPAQFRDGRLDGAAKEDFVVQQAVRMRGWPLPYFDGRQPLLRHGRWIGQDFESSRVPHMEAWRMTSSGMFAHRRVLATDLRDSQQLAATNDGAVGTVAVWDILLYLVELTELGVRLATSLYLDAVVFEVNLKGVKQRQLVSGTGEREIADRYIISTDVLTVNSTASTTTLIEDPRGMGVGLAQGIFQQFGLSVPDQLLRDWQEQIFASA